MTDTLDLSDRVAECPQCGKGVLTNLLGTRVIPHRGYYPNGWRERCDGHYIPLKSKQAPGAQPQKDGIRCSGSHIVLEDEVIEPYTHYCPKCVWVGRFSPWKDRPVLCVYLCGKTVMLRHSPVHDNCWVGSAGGREGGPACRPDTRSERPGRRAADHPRVSL